MRQSKLFLKTQREAPKDEEATNAKLLTRAGFVEKLMAGVYNYLPLGLKVLRKIEVIVREEMDAIGGQEILMPMLHPKEIWKITGGWDKIEILFKIKSRTGKEYALGQSEEEVVTPLVMGRALTYRDLPLAVYQIHWKFRDELRSKSGLLRGVEFYMKDMYSFHEHQEDFEQFYGVAKKAYLRVFERLGLAAKVTEASGGSFTEKISYEFMVLTEGGEDRILYCGACEFCANATIAREKKGDRCPRCHKGTLTDGIASEVGNVFDLGQKYGKDFNLTFKDRNNESQYPVMGCYGIGISRLMGVIVEKFHDDRGITWPASVAPAQVHLLRIGEAAPALTKFADGVYDELVRAGVEVLYDDREGVSPGEKFADADLIGLPWRAVVSEKTVAAGKVELKRRTETETTLVKPKDVGMVVGGR
ncbi:MAG: aminoacyl--tRNA ligase-related protein [Candidatus Jorgensenbacteria bacterium]